MKLTVSPLFTLLYRGTLEDTASLVGLVNTGASVGVIAFTGSPTPEMKKYIQMVNAWLKLRDVPEIKINPILSGSELKNIVDSPYKQWQWGFEECALALKLSGLPAPRNLKLVNNALEGD